MFANFTEETCTGTGDTLTLTGAITGMLPFSASFADGALVSYAVEDSGGSIKIAGIGTYNSSGNTITRADTWNYNGSVIDKNPSANITLSGGTHKVRCSASALSANGIGSFLASTDASHNIFADNWASANGNGSTLGVNMIYAVPAFFSSYIRFSKLSVTVITEDAVGLANVGICSSGQDGMPKSLLANAEAVDITTTGIKTVSLEKELLLPPGRYFMLFQSDSGVVRMRSINDLTHGGRAAGYQHRSYTNGPVRVDTGSFGIPSDLSPYVTGFSDPLLNVMVCPEA